MDDLPILPEEDEVSRLFQQPARQQRSLTIDISRGEYVDPSEAKSLDGYRLHVYTPLMIVLEKLRSICQQMSEYCTRMGKHSSERARDFFDIHLLVTEFQLNLTTVDALQMLEAIFSAKDVPLKSLGKIRNTREIHVSGYTTLQSTIPARDNIMEFDFYFHYVCDLADQIIRNVADNTDSTLPKRGGPSWRMPDRT